MVRAFSALPARALHGRPPVLAGAVVLGVFALLMFGSMLGFMAVFVPPGLVADWQVRDTARLLRDGSVSDGTCDGHDLLEMCDMTVSAPVGTDTVYRRVHLMFVSSRGRAFEVSAVADPAHPGTLTTDLGLDMFWNRVATFAGAFLVVAGLTGLGVWAGLRGLLRRRAWRRADCVPVALRLVARQRMRGGEVWTVRSEEGRQERWTLPRRATPFVLGPADEILGLQQPGGAVMPLDDRLRWVDLSAAERAAVLRR